MQELLLQLLIFAYACAGAIGVIGYIPTIKDLWLHKKRARISIHTLFGLFAQE